VINSGDGDPELLVQALQSLQALLPPTGYVVGKFSIADVAIAPFLLRLKLLLDNDFGGWPAGEGKGAKILTLIRQSGLERIRGYTRELQAHPSVAATWDKVRVTLD
jgi:glutathione S-transferase